MLFLCYIVEYNSIVLVFTGCKSGVTEIFIVARGVSSWRNKDKKC